MTLERDTDTILVFCGAYSGYGTITYDGTTISRSSLWYGDSYQGLALSISTFTGNFKKGKVVSATTAPYCGAAIVY